MNLPASGKLPTYTFTLLPQLSSSDKCVFQAVISNAFGKPAGVLAKYLLIAAAVKLTARKPTDRYASTRALLPRVLVPYRLASWEPPLCDLAQVIPGLIPAPPRKL
ncbi:hypothetical protein MTO96_043477 [Rhipicephalus appendiculatus]